MCAYRLLAEEVLPWISVRAAEYENIYIGYLNSHSFKNEQTNSYN